MSILVVSHCYAERLPLFAGALRYQLSSLLLNKPTVPVTIEVCCTYSDTRTVDVLEEFKDLLGDSLRARFMTEERLWRRAIGRNEAALESTEDLVWFCDVDYSFGMNTFNYLWYFWARTYQKAEVGMLYPKQVYASTTHEMGDEMLEDALKFGGQPVVNRSMFSPKPYTKAIGGAQIVRGELAREIGYLKGHEKWQRPASSPFPDTRDDVQARKAYLEFGPAIPLLLPDIYRIRHSASSYRNSSK